jgi:hypothetical protein
VNGPRATPAPVAPLSLTDSGGPRRARWIRAEPIAGTLAAALGIELRERTTDTPADRRQARETWLARMYAAPRVELTLEDLLQQSRPPLINFWQLAQKHVAAGPGESLRDAAPVAQPGAYADAVRLLIGAYSQTAYSFRDRDRPTVRETFADPYLQREVFRAQLDDRARVLAQTRAEFPLSGKFRDIRYLRAIVRNRNVELYAVRSALRKCGQVRHSRDGVEAHATAGADGRDRVSLSGIIRCGSVHSCPRCAPRISAQRAELLKRIVAKHRDVQGGVYMLTLTVPHTAGMALRTLRRGVAAAWKLTQQGAPWRRLKKRMRFVGSVAAREVTHGANGWHPHLHILIATRSPLTAREQARIRRAIRERWVEAVARQDVAAIGRPSRRHGVKFQAQRDESYLQKLGLADELIGAIHKVGRDGNRTPFAIMADYARAKNARDAAILREYHRAMKRARQLTWSRGRAGCEDLRQVYLGDADPAQLALLDSETLNAEQLQADDSKSGVVVATIPAPQWDALARVMRAARSDAEAELVLAIEEHGASGARALLESAYRIGRELAAKRPRLRRWLWWLDPRREHADKVLQHLRR